MNILWNNEVLKELANENKSQNIQEALTETLWWKTFDLKKFQNYVYKKINEVKNRDNDLENYELNNDLNLLRVKRRSWVERIPEDFVRKTLKDLTQYLWNKWAILREPFTQDIPYFRANYNDKDYYLNWIKDRSLPVKEYEKMQDQIEKHGSILARSNRRNWQFGGWDWDVILSLTTWKLYDVDWKWAEALEQDYNSKQYYSSRSWMSGAGSFMAWKWSLIYMPTSRMDVTYPELYLNDINGLKMTMCTSRWVVDENLPTIIKSWKVNLWVDVVLLSQKNHLEQWTARDLINTIETKWENLKDWPVYTFKIRYLDENFEEKGKVFTYKTNMNPKDINFKAIWRECFWINRWFDVEQTWSFIDRVVWIRKYNWKYVRLWQFGLVKEVFDEHPHSKMDSTYYDDIEIGPKNEIIHKKVEVEPMFAEYKSHKQFNGWTLWDNFAYKNIKDSYRIDDFELWEICSEHELQYNESLLNDDVYYLVYEDDVSEYNELLKKAWKVNMEFEYRVPRAIFEQFSVEYRKSFLNKKLKLKAMLSIDIHTFSETTQKDIAKNYLKTHQNTVFTLEDSYNSWNCRPWTARFIETFGLPNELKGKDLLKHKDFEKMLSIYDFRKIFVKKAIGRK